MQSKNMKAHVKFYRAGEMKNKLSGSAFRFWSNTNTDTMKRGAMPWIKLLMILF